MLLVGLAGRRVLVLVEISLLAVPVLWLLLKPVMLLIDGSLLIFRFLLAFVLMLGWLMLLVRLLVNPLGLRAGWDTPDRSSSSSSRLIQDVWDVYRDDLGVVPEEVVHALRSAASRSAVDDFWSIWSKNAEAGLFRAYALAGGHTNAGRSAFLGRGLFRIRRQASGRQSCWWYGLEQVFSCLPR